MDFNPYYEEKIKSLNAMLKKVQDENAELEEQNKEISLSLEALDKEIQTNYDEIVKSIEPLKNLK